VGINQQSISRARDAGKIAKWVALSATAISIASEAYFGYVLEAKRVDAEYPTGISFWPKLSLIIGDPSFFPRVLGTAMGILLAACVLVGAPIYFIARRLGASNLRAALLATVGVLAIVLIRSAGCLR